MFAFILRDKAFKALEKHLFSFYGNSEITFDYVLHLFNVKEFDIYLNIH